MYTWLTGKPVQNLSYNINNSTQFPIMSIHVEKEPNKKYFTQCFVYISVIVILNIKYRNLINFRSKIRQRRNSSSNLCIFQFLSTHHENIPIKF